MNEYSKSELEAVHILSAAKNHVFGDEVQKQIDSLKIALEWCHSESVEKTISILNGIPEYKTWRFKNVNDYLLVLRSAESGNKLLKIVSAGESDGDNFSEKFDILKDEFCYLDTVLERINFKDFDYSRALAFIKEINDSSENCIEQAHINADQVVIIFLESQGYLELANIYNDIPKWFA